MRTLSEIVSAAQSYEPATAEELRYALCAVKALAKFDEMDLMKMAQKEREGKALWAWMRYEESFNRWKRAFEKSPIEWLGWNNDPANPEYQQRRKQANKILEAALEGKLPNQRGEDA